MVFSIVYLGQVSFYGGRLFFSVLNARMIYKLALTIQLSVFLSYQTVVAFSLTTKNLVSCFLSRPSPYLFVSEFVLESQLSGKVVLLFLAAHLRGTDFSNNLYGMNDLYGLKGMNYSQ